MSERFIAKGDGVIFDTKTNMEWHPESYLGTWDECKEWCESLGDGWHIPNDEELCSVINREKIEPATDMPGWEQKCYWSSIPYAKHTGLAWRVSFYDGYVNCYVKSYSYYVRAVRGGQDGSLDNSVIDEVQP